MRRSTTTASGRSSSSSLTRRRSSNEDRPAGGLAIASGPLNTTSASVGRSYADAKRYPFGAGSHREAMRRDRAEGHHRTEWFLRIRPLAETGTLAGVAPLAKTRAARVALPS